MNGSDTLFFPCLGLLNNRLHEKIEFAAIIDSKVERRVGPVPHNFDIWMLPFECRKLLQNAGANLHVPPKTYDVNVGASSVEDSEAWIKQTGCGEKSPWMISTLEQFDL